MYKTVRSKIKLFIAVIIIVVSLIAIKKLVVDPQPVRDIKMNTVYICGFWNRYPVRTQSRYYIEFKDDKTYILMHDDSRRHQENYGEDGDGSKPGIKIYFGKYEISNGNYMLKTTDSAGVWFENTMAVAKKKINHYSNGVFKVEKYMLEDHGRSAEINIFRTKKGQYVLGYSNNEDVSYDKKRNSYLLYNKSDIKKLPNSVEEFRKQFKMDKKAEQERLAEEARLTGQSQ